MDRDRAERDATFRAFLFGASPPGIRGRLTSKLTSLETSRDQITPFTSPLRAKKEFGRVDVAAVTGINGRNTVAGVRGAIITPFPSHPVRSSTLSINQDNEPSIDLTATGLPWASSSSFACARNWPARPAPPSRATKYTTMRPYRLQCTDEYTP